MSFPGKRKFSMGVHPAREKSSKRQNGAGKRTTWSTSQGDSSASRFQSSEDFAASSPRRVSDTIETRNRIDFNDYFYNSYRNGNWTARNDDFSHHTHSAAIEAQYHESRELQTMNLPSGNDEDPILLDVVHTPASFPPDPMPLGPAPQARMTIHTRPSTGTDLPDPTSLNESIMDIPQQTVQRSTSVGSSSSSSDASNYSSTSDPDSDTGDDPYYRRKSPKVSPLDSTHCKRQSCPDRPEWWFLPLHGSGPVQLCFACRALKDLPGSNFAEAKLNALRWYEDSVKPKLQQHRRNTSARNITREEVEHVWTVIVERIWNKFSDDIPHFPEDSEYLPEPEAIQNAQHDVENTITRGSLRSHNTRAADGTNDIAGQPQQTDLGSRGSASAGRPSASTSVESAGRSVEHTKDCSDTSHESAGINSTSPSNAINGKGKLLRISHAPETTDSARAMPDMFTIVASPLHETPIDNVPITGATASSANVEAPGVLEPPSPAEHSSTLQSPATDSAVAAAPLPPTLAWNQAEEGVTASDPPISPPAQLPPAAEQILPRTSHLTTEETSSPAQMPAAENGISLPESRLPGKEPSSGTSIASENQSSAGSSVMPQVLPAVSGSTAPRSTTPPPTPNTPLMQDIPPTESPEAVSAGLREMIELCTEMCSAIDTPTDRDLLLNMPLVKLLPRFRQDLKCFYELRQESKRDQWTCNELSKDLEAAQRAADEARNAQEEIQRKQEGFRKRALERRLRAAEIGKS